ncbi:ATP-dependent helicase [Sedimentibacter sp. MB31-C6]|uniref:ATP-dependent helicase n=1 Tax=Sedimentibacter sp. MB31-C6 TaxID=3109366 RepID=UPI002DDCAF01|nr:ATP-dependent helicase [Sedimentibacter sp. MB36-C1]WSI03818.1 ATP-dependent helicase [Sedimentibacter sp. MB36-C1]
MEYFEYFKKAYNVELNKQQRYAVSFDQGNALVLSTAGSGKTTVIISRAGRLLYERKCNKKILTITFSKMAASDMKNRFQLYFGDKYKYQTEFSTIHAFAYKIVKEFYRSKGIEFNLLTNNYQILGEILKSHYSKSYFNYISDEEIETLASSIGYINNMMLKPSEYKDYGIDIKEFDLIYNKYRNYKSQNKLIDFDDMLLYAYKILFKSNLIRDKIKNTYQYIQIDEMQDTSKIQHEIIKLISGNNLFMVGDDDQSIYSFRGSYPDFMFQFKDIYKEGKIFYLDNNFRSDKNIVNGAKNFIQGNKNRYSKAITTENPQEKEINISKVQSRREQSKYIVNDILNIKGKASIGILYRYNMSAMILANSLYENNLSFYIKEDKTKFFNSVVLQDILAFLNLSLDPTDREAFARIYYKSYTYFTKSMCKRVLENPNFDMTVFDILNNIRGLDYYVYDRIDTFRRDINYINKLKPKDIIRFIKLDLEYMNYIERMQEEGRNNMSNSLHILEILDEIGSNCDNIKEFINKIYKLQEIIKNASINKESNITLTTIHSAKGLEYDYVYMIDNIDGEFPLDRKNMSHKEYEKFLEEERRIFYVGMTRAKKVLKILVPGVPSLFVNELINSNKKNNIRDRNIHVGKQVSHNKFGNGVVIDINDNIVYIKFNNEKIKSFDLSLSLENNILELL